MNHPFATSVGTIERAPLDYTIGTLVTRDRDYAEMTAAFVAAGFDTDRCEYLCVDNTTTNTCDAFAGINLMLNRARGRHVILCHQDVRPIETRQTLDERLADLDRHDPHWALAGNAGGKGPGRLAIRITDPYGRDSRIGELPCRVDSLDENFLVVKASTRIGCSHNLKGFHLYGADLCLAADIAGHTAYVIDYHLEHLSPGTKDATFTAMVDAFRKKWSSALKPRWLQTPCTLVRLTGDSLDRTIGRIAEPLVAKAARRLPGASGWHRGR